MQRTNKILQNTENEIKRCILLKTKERDAWLELVRKASPLTLESIFRIFLERNRILGVYILEAFRHDPDQLEVLKQKVSMVKKTAMRMQEDYERPSEMENAEIQIQNL
jgi:hypothetical protein